MILRRSQRISTLLQPFSKALFLYHNRLSIFSAADLRSILTNVYLSCCARLSSLLGFYGYFFYLCCRHFYLIDNDYYKVYFIFTIILLINSSIFVKRPLWEKKSCYKLPNGHEPMQWHQKQTSPITFIYIEYIHIYFFEYIYIFYI